MKHLLLFILIIWSSLLLAQETGIPTKYMNDPAVDLTRNGEVLYPDEVHELMTTLKNRFDISTLNPITTSDLWKDTYLKNLPEEIPAIQDHAEVDYDSNVLSPSGIFRFNIHNKNGDQKLYTMMLSKSVHTALLIKSTLRKIGYNVPDIKRLSQVTIKFKSEQEKLSFRSYLEKVAMAGAADNWIIDDLGDKLVLQDLVVMKSNHDIYNLAFGVTDDMVQGRRLLSATAVPLAIVNLPESINMMSWTVGVVNNSRIRLNLDNADDFQATWDDARWVTRRLEKLTRDDWAQIVVSSQVPKPVQQVMLEKIISRRNSAMKLFKIEAQELPVDSKTNNGLELIDGKLTQQRWEGFASRFAHGDPESPLSDSDMKSWIRSRAYSTAMELGLGYLNQLKYLGTDIQANTEAKFEKIVADAVAKAILEKKPAELPVKSFVFPTFRGSLILSRNLVTGTYLGTDNLVQLVDTVGVSVSAGAYAGVVGIKSGVTPVNVAGGSQGSFIRTYAHLRPVLNIKRSLKYPFKNVLVPLVKKDLGRKLHEAYTQVIDPTLSQDARENAVAKALKPFKDTMNIGESILVTDTLAVGVAGQAGVNLYGKLFSASLGLSSNHIVLSRFHVHRRSEDSFHIYRDLGHRGSVGVNLGLDSLIPVVSLTYKKSGGHARVKFFKLDLSKSNPEALNHAQLLRSALLHSSTKDLEEKDIKPYIVKHSFKESSPSMNLLFWQFIQQNSSTDITVVNPEGDEKYFRRHYYGRTQGRNYQAYVNALVNHWVGLLFDRQAGLSEATGTNPGYSFKGQARTNFLTLDQELDERGEVIEPFVSLSRVWNGWSINQKKANELLEEIRQQYKFQFYNAPVLNDTSKIYLYNIGVNVLFYKKGLEHMLSLTDNQIKRIFLEHQRQHSLVVNPNIASEKENEDYDDEKYADTGVNKFLRLLRKYKRLDLKNKDDRANKNFLKAINYMEKTIYLPGIVKMVGGEENIYVNSRITGFREGDENGDRPLVSSSLGQYGSPRVLGPIIQVQKTTDMLEGEFFINWLMQRLI